MNRRRAVSSSASWRCMSSSARASSPSSSSPSTGNGAEKSPLATRRRDARQPAHPPSERLRDEEARQDGGREGQDAGDHDAVADERDVALDVAQRRRVDEHVAEQLLPALGVAEEQRHRDLDDASAADRFRRRLGAARLDRGVGGREVQVADVRAQVGVGLRERLRTERPAVDAQEGDAGVRLVGGGAHGAIDGVDGHRELQRRPDRIGEPRGVGPQGDAALVDQARLERRDDAEVDDDDRPERDQEEDERQAVGE